MAKKTVINAIELQINQWLIKKLHKQPKLKC